MVAHTGKDPATGQALAVTDLYPNLALRDLIQEWTVTHADALDPNLVQRVTAEHDAARARNGDRAGAVGAAAVDDRDRAGAAGAQAAGGVQAAQGENGHARERVEQEP